MTIQRYKFSFFDGKYHLFPDGDYVLYTDHIAALETQREEWRDNKRYLENDLALKQEQIVALEAAVKEKEKKHAEDIASLIKQLQLAGKQIATLESDLEINTKLLANQCDMAREAETALAEKDVDWQLKYDILINDYEQEWGLSNRLQEQIAVLEMAVKEKDKVIRKSCVIILGTVKEILRQLNNRDKRLQDEALRGGEEKVSCQR